MTDLEQQHRRNKSSVVGCGGVWVLKLNEPCPVSDSGSCQGKSRNREGLAEWRMARIRGTGFVEIE